ncbi:MAG: fibrobacter succinogenes major paralogous domain-containing protein, partial [Bacteroidales bacterium]
KTITFDFKACTDGDGNNYTIVKIGSQFWMAENLATTKNRYGKDIPLVTSNTEWASLSTGAYCWYDNDEAKYKDTYGALYNWYIVYSTALCPSGWHVPTDNEWTTLVDYLGGKDVAAGKIKEAGYTHWQSPNIGATNESGFTALPGGHRRDYNGIFTDITRYAPWWSISEENTTHAWARSTFYNQASLNRYTHPKEYGYSVRCVRK